MRHGLQNRLVAATLLIAALAAYVDLPRLYQTSCLGDTLNAVRVFDAIQHSRMVRDVAETGEVNSGLNEGLESLAVVLQVAPLQAIIQPTFEMPRGPSFHEAAPSIGDSDYLPLTAIAGALLKLDIPPPRLEALWQPLRLKTSRLPGLTHTARGPPLRF